jgi:outer membrane protein OmpA-like peptidoglycan-associated protein
LKKQIIFFAFSFFGTLLQSQNLVPDGSFEFLKEKWETNCNSLESINKLKFWNSAIQKVSWLRLINGEDKNCSGSKARSGKYLLGFLVYAETATNSKGDKLEKDYESPLIQTKLSSALIRGKTYIISMHVKRFSPTSWIAADRFTIAFSDHPSRKLDELGSVSLYKGSSPGMIRDTNWVKVSAKYVAKGDEEYLYLASFLNTVKFETDADAKHKVNGNSYYFLDDLAVVWDTTIPIVDLGLPTKFKKGVPISLNNISFQTGKSVLLPESYKELDKLIKLLKENPSAQIEIRGHTDNIGEENENQKLSEDRAKTVYEYLAGKGVDKARLSYKGYGSTKPIADNKSEPGRKSNRRVEFIVLKL